METIKRYVSNSAGENSLSKEQDLPDLTRNEPGISE